MRLQILAFILLSFIAIHQCQAAPDSADEPDSLEYDYAPLLQSGAGASGTAAKSVSSGKAVGAKRIAAKVNLMQLQEVKETTPVPGWSDDNYILNDTYYDRKYRYNSYEDYNRGRKYDNDDYDKKYDNDKYRSRRRNRSPDSMGHLNIYVRDSSKRGGGKKYQRIRFPTAQYKRRHYPRNFGRLISFLPWVPIFVDPLTKQTIIHSPAGGIFIIPPLINFYGKLFSVGQLIAWGYASLVSSGAPPPPAVDVAPLVQPGAVVGPGVPSVDLKSGGFDGGVRTEFRSFSRPDYPKYVGGRDDYDGPRNYGQQRRGGYY